MTATTSSPGAPAAPGLAPVYVTLDEHAYDFVTREGGLKPGTLMLPIQGEARYVSNDVLNQMAGHPVTVIVERNSEYAGLVLARRIRSVCDDVRVVGPPPGVDTLSAFLAGLVDVDDEVSWVCHLPPLITDDVGPLVEVSDADTIAERYPALDWDDVLNGERQAVEWLVPGVFARGRNYALVSAAKAGKSLIMQDLGGRPGVRTLYLDFENTVDDLRDRMTAMGRQAGDLEGLAYLSFPPLPPLDTIVGGAELAALVAHYKPDLVVIDTLARVVTGEENSSDTYRALYRHALMPLKAAGVTIVRLDHLGKDATAGARGSSAKADDVDCVWVLTEHTAGKRYIMRRERQRSNDHPEFVSFDRRYEPLRHEWTVDGVIAPELLRIVGLLDEADADIDIGRDRARRLLRGEKVSNSVLSEALKRRREAAETCPGQVESPPSANTSRNLSGTGSANEDVFAAQTCPGQVADRLFESRGVDLSAPGPADRQDRSADTPTSPGGPACTMCGFAMALAADIEAGGHLGCLDGGGSA